jgi:hypothetical protein
MGELADTIYTDLVGRGKDPETARSWKTWTERFESCCGIKEKYDRQDLMKFLVWERQQGFLQNSINTHLRPLKLLAQIQKWEFPKLSMPKVKKEDITRTIFTKEQVISLIQMGRQLLEPKELAWLALATTYGLRREELGYPEPPEITDSKITIHTVKGGPTTTHLIPEEIVPFLDAYKPYSTDYMSHRFLQILYKTGIKVGKKYGWHSIRRSLATELLLSEASALNISRFMRWSDATLKQEFGMLTIYAKKDQARIDKQIFRIHPFLPYWGSGETREIQRRSKLQSLIDLLESGELEEGEIEQLITMLRVGKDVS